MKNKSNQKSEMGRKLISDYFLALKLANNNRYAE